MAAATTLHSFQRLPTEIRHQIWSHGCIQQGRNNARIQRIAKDTYGRERTLANPLQLRILSQKRYQVPSLLHVCHDSRSLAKDHWSLWPCAEPLAFYDDGTFVYVNKEHDTFYFADGVPTDFWILSSFVGFHVNSLELSDEDHEKVQEQWKESILGIRHFAVDWWCWLKATTFCDWTWMNGLGLSEDGDLTIVIKNPNDPGHTPEFSSYVVPRLREVTPGTTRAKAVDAVLTHIKYKEVKEEFLSDTQTIKSKKPADEENCCVPMLKALAVVGPEDDENSKEDEEYLEVVTRQARYHRVKHDLRNLMHEQRKLAREIKDMDIQFPVEHFGLPFS